MKKLYNTLFICSQRNIFTLVDLLWFSLYWMIELLLSFYIEKYVWMCEACERQVFVFCAPLGPDSDSVFYDFKQSSASALSGPSINRGNTMTNGVKHYSSSRVQLLSALYLIQSDNNGNCAKCQTLCCLQQNTRFNGFSSRNAILL